MTQAIIGNGAHPKYGVATIPFPIPLTEYANCLALLEALEIGGPWPVLKRLALAVNKLPWDQRMKLVAVAAMAELMRGIAEAQHKTLRGQSGKAQLPAKGKPRPVAGLRGREEGKSLTLR